MLKWSLDVADRPAWGDGWAGRAMRLSCQVSQNRGHGESEGCMPSKQTLEAERRGIPEALLLPGRRDATPERV